MMAHKINNDRISNNQTERALINKVIQRMVII